MDELKPGDVLKCITDRCYFGGREWSGDDTIFVTKIEKVESIPPSNRIKDWDYIEGWASDKTTVCFIRKDLYERFRVV